jgi:hypothetical protein
LLLLRPSVPSSRCLISRTCRYCLQDGYSLSTATLCSDGGEGGFGDYEIRAGKECARRCSQQKGTSHASRHSTPPRKCGWSCIRGPLDVLMLRMTVELIDTMRALNTVTTRLMWVAIGVAVVGVIVSAAQKVYPGWCAIDKPARKPRSPVLMPIPLLRKFRASGPRPMRFRK